MLFRNVSFVLNDTFNFKKRLRPKQRARLHLVFDFIPSRFESVVNFLHTTRREYKFA